MISNYIKFYIQHTAHWKYKRRLIYKITHINIKA